jgi:ferrous iron transport protein A
MVAMSRLLSPLVPGAAKCYYEAFAILGKMPDTSILALNSLTLGDAPVGFRGHIVAVDMNLEGSGLSGAELERRLLELGFVEGAEVEVLHEGLFGADPIAVRVADSTIALRRREAMAVSVAKEPGS